MMPSRQNRKARRAAERATQKLQLNDETRGSICDDNDPVPIRAREQAVSEPSPLSPARRAANRTNEKLQLNDETRDSISDDNNTVPIRAREQAVSQPSPLSPARLAANRANAQLSTGPTSESGKATSSKNALKTALTGRTVLLPEDDADRYERHLNQYKKAYQPVGERELELVQSLADTTWRIDRIPGLEEALYFKGSNELAAEVAELAPHARAAMLRMQTYLAYERQFRNLNIQEMRLHRLREKLIAEIQQLQKEREQKEKDDLAIAAKLYVAAKHDRKSFEPADYGFEFSTSDVEAYLHGQRASMLTERAMTGHGQ